MYDLKEFSCPNCRGETRVKQVKKKDETTLRHRLCECGYRFKTRENGHGEVFVAPVIPKHIYHSPEHLEKRALVRRIRWTFTKKGQVKFRKALDNVALRMGLT